MLIVPDQSTDPFPFCLSLFPISSVLLRGEEWRVSKPEISKLWGGENRWKNGTGRSESTQRLILMCGLRTQLFMAVSAFGWLIGGGSSGRPRAGSESFKRDSGSWSKPKKLPRPQVHHQ